MDKTGRTGKAHLISYSELICHQIAKLCLQDHLTGENAILLAASKNPESLL
jgi:hypothetical protein